MKNRQIEILAPAGSCESLKAAVSAGADAVYVGGTRFGARAYADNPGEAELLDAIDYVHLHGRKLYMTVNTLLKDAELEELYDYLLPYYKQGLDAVIVQDFGVLSFMREHFPDLPIHVSTQATVVHALGAEFFKAQGAERIVPARELNLAEIRQMKEETGLEIECFVHGALCYCYSGQCLMSSMIGGRSGNRGQCAQPCRLPYDAGDGKAKDLMSLKDLCTIDKIPDLIEAGIDSFKIEGRMKQPDYVYTVVRMYRKYTDLYFERGREGFRVSAKDREILEGAYRRRGYSDGYYQRQNGREMISFARPKSGKEPAALEETLYKIKEKINGELILSEGSRAKLYLWRETVTAECEGAEVQTAQKHPLDEERVRRQMEKTGDTEFEFENLNISIEGNIFLPMQALNELRREGLELLRERIAGAYHRQEPTETAEPAETAELMKIAAPAETAEPMKIADQAGTAEPTETTEQTETCRLAVSVSDAVQLRTALKDGRISALYVDGNFAFDPETLEQIRAFRPRGGCRVYAAMPYIFRERAQRLYEADYRLLEQTYDGALIRNFESYMWLIKHGYQKEMTADYNLYVFNRKSREFLRRAWIRNYTAPVELNSHELGRLDIRGAVLIGYGYQPVMISANCIQKNTGGCTKKDGVRYLADRRQKKFAVKNYCKYCYNVTYNPVPLVLLSQAEEIRELAPAYVRLDFVTESADEMKKITDLYAQAFLEGREVRFPGTEYTKGHFKRGVK